MISFIVLVYRSAKSLAELHRLICAILGAGEQDLDILFVEDYSGDDS